MPERPWPDSAIDPAIAEAAQLDSLRAEGHWRVALTEATQRVRRFELSGGRPRWRTADAHREQRLLRRILAMPAAVRDSLALADRLRRNADHEHHHDALDRASADGLRALRLYEGLLGPRDPETGRARMELAHTLFELGRFSAADSLVRMALPALVDSCGEQHPWVAETEQILGWVQKNSAEAFTRAIRHESSLSPGKLSIADYRKRGGHSLEGTPWEAAWRSACGSAAC